MKILLFTGAGASVELGVPAMREMAEQFRDHLGEQRIEASILDAIEKQLQVHNYDMEGLLDELDSIARGAAAGGRWGIGVGTPLVSTIEDIRREAEWFVLHVCERIQAKWARQLWQPTLRNVRSHELTIATTNYDRAVEIAVAPLEIQIEDGFADFADAECARWRGFVGTSGIRLLKLHGSTDWYHGDNAQSVWKLRHPMSLFGGVTLSAGTPGNLTLTGAAILPSREKRVTEHPYPDLSFEFRNAIDGADLVIFVGTSFRDPDIRAACCRCTSRKKPTLVVSRSCNYEKGLVPEHAGLLAQSASRFLVSTFPSFLKSPDLSRMEKLVEFEDKQIEPVLEWLDIANSSRRSPKERCAHIDKLAGARVALDKEDVEKLLRDNELDVKINALGLVQDSFCSRELIESVKSMDSSDLHPQLQSEICLLVDLMDKKLKTSPAT